VQEQKILVFVASSICVSGIAKLLSGKRKKLYFATVKTVSLKLSGA
jgi:hypothetical protein